MTKNPKPEIIMIANYLPDKQESMLRVSTLYKDIVEEEGFKVKIMRAEDRVGKLRTLFPKIEKWLNYVDKIIIFSIELVTHNILHSWNNKIVYHIIDHSNAIYSLCLLNRAKIITCHDVLAINSMMGKIPGNRLGWSGNLLQKIILAGLKCNNQIVCVSKKTEDEVRKLVGDKNRKITTILQPLNYNFRQLKKDSAMKTVMKLSEWDNRCLKKGFILHIGGNQWYKNRLGLCSIYRELNRIRSRCNQSCIPLILAGKEPSEELRDYTKQNLDLKILFLIEPTNNEINALYSLASLLLFPSIEEGFGWPIVEAMACGCPVVTTGRKPMTEAGGNAAIYIDPSDIKSAAVVVNDVIEWNSSRREMQARLGYQNVRNFSRKEFTQKYIREYHNALDQ